MADIELVIKIPEEVKQALDNNEEYRLYTESVGHTILTAIKNGTPLPKGHGRLKDVDWIDDYCSDYRTEDGAWCYKWEDIDEAPTIIPATKEQQTEKNCLNCRYYPNTAPCDSCYGYSNYNEWQTATKADCNLSDCKCNDNGKCTDGLAYKESCYDCYIPATKEDERMDEINLPIKHESKPYLMIPFPDRATNGDVIKALFPDAEFDNAMPFTDGRWETMNLDTKNSVRATYKPTQLRTYAEWWNAPYKEGESK